MERVQDIDFDSASTLERTNYMKNKYGILYLPTKSYDVVYDEELFSLFMLEHGDLLIEISPKL